MDCGKMQRGFSEFDPASPATGGHVRTIFLSAAAREALAEQIASIDGITGAAAREQIEQMLHGDLGGCDELALTLAFARQFAARR